MNKDREKICSHCEGRISIEADTCLYCGMPLLGEASPQPMSQQENNASLYPPPYSNRNTAYVNVDRDLAKKFAKKPQAASQVAAVAEKKEEDASGFFPLFLSLLGSTLFVLGLMQGFFSEQGVLRLEWNCNYWFAFCLVSLPLLYLGFKKKNS